MNGEKLEWEIEIPANTTATVHVPAMRNKNVTESGNPLGQAHGVKLLRGEKDRIVLQLGSGKYKLLSE
jgi:alpha-L-rhamnosidase